MSGRLEWLASVGAVAAGGFCLNAALSAEGENNPAANVADRTTTIKITKLTATPMQPKVFLKLETNHGVTGWGEIDQLEPYVAAKLAQSLFEINAKSVQRGRWRVDFKHQMSFVQAAGFNTCGASVC